MKILSLQGVFDAKAPGWDNRVVTLSSTSHNDLRRILGVDAYIESKNGNNVSEVTNKEFHNILDKLLQD